MIGWQSLPAELLIKIFEFLDAQSLQNCTNVCHQWRYCSIDNCLWKPLFRKNYLWFHESPLVHLTFHQEFRYFKECIPVKLKYIIDDFDYDINMCSFSKDGSYFGVIGEESHFCIYETNPIEFIHERCVKISLTWNKISDIQFSPNSKKFLLNGIRMDGTGEVAIFEIDHSNKEVHFLSRVSSNPSDFTATWYDDDYIIIGDIRHFNTTNSLGSSVSFIQLCNVGKCANGSLIKNIARFLNVRNDSYIRKPVIGSFVSSRFRRIIQISEQAKMEGMTLKDKLCEISFSANIDCDNISSIKEILDKENECIDCYFQHKDYTKTNTNCCCCCHKDAKKLLMYITESTPNRLYFKVVDYDQLLNEETISEPRKDFERKEVSLKNILDEFDYQDYHIDLDGEIMNIVPSLDQKIIYVHLRDFESPSSYHVRAINLEKMVIDPYGVNGIIENEREPCITVNNRLVARSTENTVYFWSHNYRGSFIQQLQMDKVLSMSLHPLKNQLVTVHKKHVCIYAT